MKTFSMSIHITVVFSLLFLSASFSPASANHNSAVSLEARVAAIGTLQIAEAGTATDEDDTDDFEDGETVYDATCATCHDNGVAGAPIVGEIDDWAERIEQGIEVLTEHALQGFTGASGIMPAKGGNPALSDDAITAAVEFMVDQSE